MKRSVILSILIMLSITFGEETKMSTIDIFYKNKKASQQVISEIKKVVVKYENTYAISYYLITDSSTAGIINTYGLPSTHFPVAVVINGKFTAKINNKIISFVHFPDFMKGIGRHEGNWSISYLEEVLNNNSLLTNKNILPKLKEESEHGKDECSE